MQFGMNSIIIIFVGLLVCIDLLRDNQIEARGIDKYLHNAALRNMQFQHLPFRKRRDLVDELQAEDEILELPVDFDDTPGPNLLGPGSDEQDEETNDGNDD